MSQSPAKTDLFLKLIFISLIFLAASCAEIGVPPGGEVDRIGPFVIGSIPANGALGVERTKRIEIFFSEPIVEPRSGQSVFISPRQAEAKIKFKGDRIIIELAEDFEADRTYVIGFSSTLQDRRRNALDSLTTIAFSTGSSLDSGSVSGLILSQGARPIEGKPASGTLVALYDPSKFHDTLIIDSIYPEYITTTNKDGLFSLEYLPHRPFQLIAFTDANDDQRFNPEREAQAIPDRELIIGGGLSLDHLIMRLNRRDTTSVSLLTASCTADRLVRIRLSRKIQIQPLLEMASEILLSSVEDSTRVHSLVGLRERDSIQASQLNFYFGPLEPGEYNLSFRPSETELTLSYDSLTVAEINDKAAPKIERYFPGDKPVFVRNLRLGLILSEPLDPTSLSSESIVLWGAGDEPLALEQRWLDPFHLELLPDSTLDGGSYRLTISEFDLVDLSGNLLGDSLKDLRFTILEQDSLGSASGRLIRAQGRAVDELVNLKFVSLANKTSFDLDDISDEFMIDLPAGKYLIWGLIDSDHDGEITDGRFDPWRLGETMLMHPDTIKIRARFETAGIEFDIF